MRSATPCLAALRRATARASGLRSVAVTRAPLCCLATATAMAPEPVPMSRMLGSASGFARRQALVDQRLGVRPRDQHGGADLELQREELLAADQVRHRAAFEPLADQLLEARPLLVAWPAPRSACTARCACSPGRGSAAPRRPVAANSEPFWARNCAVQSSSRP